MKGLGILAFSLVAALSLLSLPAEAEVLSKIKVIGKDGVVSYYDNLNSLIEERLFFREYKESPGKYYPVFRNSSSAYNWNEAEDGIWVEFDVLPRLMEGGSFGKGSSWFLGNVTVPVFYSHEMQPFKIRLLVAVENSYHTEISIYKVDAHVGNDEKMFLIFFSAINERTPLRVTGWLKTARYRSFTKQNLDRGYPMESVVFFEPRFVQNLWWKKEGPATTVDRNLPGIQAP